MKRWNDNNNNNNNRHNNQELTGSSEEKKSDLNTTQTPSEKTLKCLNRLAWLMERNSKSCTAVALVNKKLIISDNYICESTLENNEVFPFIFSVMNYFSGLTYKSNTDEKNLDESLKLKRIEIFKSIFDKKFSGEEMGYFSSASEYEKPIVSALLEILDAVFIQRQSQEKQEKLINTKCSALRKAAKHSKPEVMAAFQIGLDIIRRIKGIEKYISQTDGNSFQEALSYSKQSSSDIEIDDEKSEKPFTHVIWYSQHGEPSYYDSKWLQDENTRGFAILGTHPQGAHAEVKIIDFLLAIGFLTEENMDENNQVYIGISKSCCLYCQDVINISNELLPKSDLSQASCIQVSGAHNRPFEKWKESKPIFLLKGSSDESGSSHSRSEDQEDQYQKRKTSLSEKIRKEFDALHAKYYLELVDDETDHKSIESEIINAVKKENTRLIKIYQTDNEEWFYSGYDCKSETVIHIKLERSPLNKSSDLKSVEKEKILKEARVKFGRKVKVGKHMDQESDISSPTRSGEQIEHDLADSLKEIGHKILELDNLVSKKYISVDTETAMGEIKNLEFALDSLKETIKPKKTEAYSTSPHIIFNNNTNDRDQNQKENKNTGSTTFT